MKSPNLMYIDGEWTPASDNATLDIIDPATEEAIDTVPVATEADVDRALAAADRAWKTWREVDVWSRSSALRRAAEWIHAHVDDIALCMTEEQGKTLGESRGETLAAADQFDWYADEARRIYGRVVDAHSRANRIMVIRQPIGPVAAFSPWNFPALLSSRKIAPAIAAGCSIIVKPAREAPRTTLWLVQACHEAGIPGGVVNVLTGSSGMISKRLCESPIIRKVTLTGSVPVGREILHLCAESVKPVTMELGGSNPVLVFEDADIDKAAETAARAKFRNNGQVCISASRFFVQESVLAQFSARFVEIAKSLRQGNGRDPQTEVGPLANLRRLEATEAFVEDAAAKGATVACGGCRPPEFKKGYFYKPTVLTGVDATMNIMNEEPFCPIAPIASFTDLEDGLRQANNTEFGLAAYVFTQNTRTAFLASEGLEAGMVGVNHLLLATAEIPFGGIKASGFGREGGTEGIEYYTVPKCINLML